MNESAEVSLKQSFGEFIKTARIISRMTLRDVHIQTNLSISYLSDIENGRTFPSFPKLLFILKAVNIDPHEFIDIFIAKDLPYKLPIPDHIVHVNTCSQCVNANAMDNCCNLYEVYFRFYPAETSVCKKFSPINTNKKLPLDNSDDSGL